MQKNVAQKWVVFAFNRTTNVPLTGDAANITANVRIDGGAANATDDVNPTELEDGYYIFDITAVECNGENILLTPVSGTADIQVIGVPGSVWTTPPNFNDLGIESDGDITKANLVATTTTNTDMYSSVMRGTDSALLATTFSTMFNGITVLAQWLGLIAGKQVANATALTEIKATGAGAGTYDEANDSLEAIRDRGDSAWSTGASGSLLAGYNGFVWYEDGSANTNTVVGTDGLPNNTVSNDTAALALMKPAGTGLRKLMVYGDLTLNASWLSTGYLRGHDLHGKILFNSQNAHDNIYQYLHLTGISIGVDDETVAKDCVIESTSGFGGIFTDCLFKGTIVIPVIPSSAWGVNINNGAPLGNYSVDFDLTGVVNKLNLWNWRGDVTIDNVDDAGSTVNIHMNGGKVTLTPQCTLGQINLSGDYVLIDNSAGSTVDISRLGLQGWNGYQFEGANMVENGAGDSRFTAQALEEAPIGGSGLTQQQVADSFNLVAANPPAAGSANDQLDDILARTNTLPIKKNTAIDHFYFIMFDTNGDAVTGDAANITAQVSKDGAAYSAVVGSITEVGQGAYKVPLLAADTNFKDGLFIFTSANASTTYKEVITESA